jgi:hypothetical protein
LQRVEFIHVTCCSIITLLDWLAPPFYPI